MNEVDCLLKNKTYIDNKEYYIVQEQLSKEEHNIPSNQINIFEDIYLNQNYYFVKEYNQSHNKTYLSIIHPKYKVGNIIEFDIEKKVKIEDRFYFYLKSEYLKTLSIEAFSWQENFEKIKCKIVGYKRGIPVLRNVDSTNNKWTIGDKKTFQIKSYGKILNKKNEELDAIFIVDENGLELTIRAGKWHKNTLWKYQDINCKIIGIARNGLPKLVINDDRHPLYSKGEIHKFIIEGFEDKVLFNESKIKVINLIDSIGEKYEVMALPNQENKLKINEEIECEIIDINTRLYLKQVNIDDPFYYDFNEILDNNELKEKYFDKYLNDDDEFNTRLKSQYIQRSGFWVLTYCNHILTKIKDELVQRRNLTEIIIILDIHTLFENWILKKGILKAIKNEDERKVIKNKTLQVIENNKSEKDVVESILNFKEKDFFEKQKKHTNFKEILYFVRHSNFISLNEIDFLKFIFKISETLTIDSANYYFIKRLITIIQKSRINFKDSIYQDYFILSQNLETNERLKIEKYINWIFIELILNRLIQLNEEANLLLSKFYRLKTFLINDFSINQKLLLNAFYIISYPEKKFESLTKIVDNKIEIIYEDLVENPNYEEIIINYKKTHHLANVTERHYQGFKLIIDKTPGFLPTQNITDQNLKYYEAQTVDWNTNIEITLYCDKFNFFIAKQLSKESSDYYSENNLISQMPSINEIIIGTVKDTTSYGVFVSTDFGDGLIHLKNISDLFVDKNKLHLLFKKGEKIPVYILDFKENKIELSLKELIGTEFEKKYYDIIQYYELDEAPIESDENSNLNFKLELEKGFIFEKFASIQSSIQDKIKYIKFAKAFFSNTKNARSYLLNIYIEYFNSLIKLDALIENYSFKKYNTFRSEIIQIKEKVQPKTLENYPESKNLLFFIDILNLFNSQKEDDIEILFNLTKKPIEENDLLLKAVAKNALANNLIISEIKNENEDELNQFTLKNLRRIREYISQGVLSVKETIEDKLAKELNEKINYWRKVISQDEGEKLEFKATFITPVPSNDKKRIIESLEKQLKKESTEINILKIKNKIEEIKEQSKNVKDIDKVIIHSALKTICAFANTNGGCLLLGVSDDKKIFGLEQDYNFFKNDKNRDGFGKYFDSMIKDYFGESFSSSLLEKEFLKFPEGDILIVKVKKSAEEIFLLKNEKGLNEESIYVRNLSSSNKLKGIELSKFIKNKLRENIINTSEINIETK